MRRVTKGPVLPSLPGIETSFLGTFLGPSDAPHRSSGLFQLSCAHLPYQAAAPNLASGSFLDPLHTQLSLWNSSHCSRHCKDVRSESTVSAQPFKSGAWENPWEEIMHSLRCCLQSLVRVWFALTFQINLSPSPSLSILQASNYCLSL